ncbi:MAG: ABC transporter ATP-binding protein [Firmicutes bacterium]|nr:ABC transporter ATP-binding protein [Bacillota bacterium]
MIQLREIKKTYVLGKTKVEALKGINLRVKKGEFVCVVGPSGSGKSTLLNIIGCLDQPDSGEVIVDNEKITNLNRNQLADFRANKIGFIFQSFNLIPVLNVYENIELPLLFMREQMPAKEKRAKIMQLIEEVGLKNEVSHKPDELSGGQRQRVAIARALVTGPKIVLADEPTANLDSATAQTIISLMRRLNEEEKVTFIFSTHDLSVTKYATNLYQLKDGRLVE